MRSYHVVLVVMSLSALSFAFPPQLLLPRGGSAPAPVGKCADFSGTWKGTCSVGGVSKSEVITIRQSGCESIQTGTETTHIGGLETRAQSYDDGAGPVSLSFTGSTDWNGDRTQLQFHYVGVMKPLGKSGSIPVRGDGGQRLDGNKLLMNLAVLGQKVSCVYEKQ